MQHPNNTSSDFVNSVPTSAGGEEVFVLEPMQTDSAWYTLHKVGRNGRWFVRKGLNDETRGKAMFERILRREYELLADIDHQNVVRVYRWIEGKDGEGSAFEMQYVDGRTLREFIAEDPSRERKIKVVRQLLDALEYIHSKQITHQDITPSNVLVSWNGDRVKLIDFGLAHDEAAQLKLPAGTEDYIAPEVLEGSTADSLSDLYSLGRVLLDINISPRVNRLVKKRVMVDKEHRIEDANRLQSAFDKAVASRRMYWIIPAVAAAGFTTGLLVNLSLRDKTASSGKQQPLANEIVRDTIRDTVMLAGAEDSVNLYSAANEQATETAPAYDAASPSLVPPQTEISPEKTTPKEATTASQTPKPTSPYGETRFPILDEGGRYKRVMDANGIYFPIEHCVSFDEYYHRQNPKPYVNGSKAWIRTDVFLKEDGSVKDVTVTQRSTDVTPTEEMEKFAIKYARGVLHYVPAQDKDGKCVPYKTFHYFYF